MYSIRNTVQALGTLPAIYEEVGASAFTQAAANIMANPGMIAEINEISPQMRERSKFVNREAAENIRAIQVSNKIGEHYQIVKEHGFMFQIAVDSLMAYPLWQAKYELERERILNSSESTPEEMKNVDKIASTVADSAVAETVGSGLDLHLSQMFHSKQAQWLKLFTQFGSWFNNYYQRVYKNTGGIDLEYMKNNPTQAIMTLWAIPSFSAIISALAIMDYPEDEEDLWPWYWKTYGSFMSGMVPFVRDIASSALSGFTPTTVFGGGAKAIKQTVYDEPKAYLEDRQSGIKTISDIALKGVGTFVPLPGSGQIARPIDFYESYMDGKEEGSPIGLFWQSIVEGTDKN